MDTTKAELLLALTEIGYRGPIEPNAGVCNNVAQLLGNGNAGRLLSGLIEKWPELGGGDPLLPVEGTLPKYYANPNKWDVNTVYGAKRYRLLAWLIYTLTKELYDSNRVA